MPGRLMRGPMPNANVHVNKDGAIMLAISVRVIRNYD